MTPKIVDEAVNILFKRISQKRKSGFRFKAPNGKNMFASEGYKTKLFAMKTIEPTKKDAAEANVDDKFAA